MFATNFSNQQSDQQLILGKWINEEDTSDQIIIESRYFYSVYKTDTLSLSEYKLSNKSCDKNYMKDSNNKNLLFMSLSNQTCYEITGLSDSTLAYRHTTSGKLHVFHKLKNKID